jgi:signal peptidase I
MKLSLPLWGASRSPLMGSSRKTFLSWAVPLAGLLAVYGLTSFVVPRLGAPSLTLYVLQPLAWLALAALVVGQWRREAAPGAFPRPRALLMTGALLGLLQVAVVLLLGLAFGFGFSPLARQWYRVLLNLWYAGTRLAGLEFGRWALLRGLSRRSPSLGLVITWLLFALIALPPAAFSQLGAVESGLIFGGRQVLPAVSENLLATLLASLGGPLPAMLLRGLPQLFEWVSPVLPQLSWMVTAFAGTIVPLLGLMLLFERYLPGLPAEAAPAKPAARETASPVGWAVLGLVAVALVWFNTGLFGVRPSLISGNSMKPTLLPGDIVVTRDAAPETVQVGDVVRFRRDGIDVIHRVKAIQPAAGGELVFVTRGDNNNVDDAPVLAEQIEGKLVFILPKVGWIIIPLRNALTGLAAWVQSGR